MILIADSGSTKTDWRLISDKKCIKEFQTEGFNPYYISKNYIIESLNSKLAPFIDINNIFNVYFYGAGCSTDSKCQLVNDALSSIFHKAAIFVDHDLLGAARALCGKNEGIACILGTGSNSCYYDGNNIIENVPSLGFMFGDEGSGGHLGKTIIGAYLKDEMPNNILERFNVKYKTNREEILTNIYKKPYPNRYLASFSIFIKENIEDEYIKNIVINCFNDFFKHQISKYTNYQSVPLSCVGSIGFFLKDFLIQTSNKYGVSVKKIIRTPIEGLIDYHIEN